MKTVLARLQAVVSNSTCSEEVTKDDALAALRDLKLAPLMLGALRLVLQHPQDPEMVNHVRRLVTHYDACPGLDCKHLAATEDAVLNRVQDLATAKPPEEQDVSDLV